MKVIDLLNKIANGEELPKAIIYKNRYELYSCNRYGATNGFYDFLEDITYEDLDKEIIVPEINLYKNKIGKIDISTFPKHNNSLKKTAIKLNEIIDYINSKED